MVGTRHRRLPQRREEEVGVANQPRLARALKDAVAFFGPPGHDADLVEAGLKSCPDDALRDRLFARLARLLEDPAAVGLDRTDDAWGLAETPAWKDWDPDRRRLDRGGPEQAILDELRGTKNVAFKTA